MVKRVIFDKKQWKQVIYLNRFRSGMRCEGKQMIKDSRLSRCLTLSADVMKCLTMSGGIVTFKNKGKRCVAKDAHLRNEVAFYISK